MDDLTTTVGDISQSSRSIMEISPGRIAKPVRLRGIALPTEHGAWGMVFEPIVAATVVAFSFAAPWIALAFVGAFLMRQPLKVLLAERKAGRKMPQGETARKFLTYFAVVLGLGAVGTVMFTSSWSLLPLAAAAPLAALQIYYDRTGRSRKLVPELAGTAAISSSAAVIALAGGWSVEASAALWGILICRSIPSILYIRGRLLLEKGKPYSAALPVAVSGAAVLLTTGLAYYGWGPRLVVAMMAILFIRAAIGLSPYSKRRKAMQIGIFEVIFGAGTVVAVIVGYRLGF